MLFVLTGDVQTGKTRWLLRLLDDLRELGVGADGVIAPGVWREDGCGDFEKLAIENRLLPDGPTIEFARRADLVEGAGKSCGWVFSQEAVALVNEHFAKLGRVVAQAGDVPAPLAPSAPPCPSAPSCSCAPYDPLAPTLSERTNVSRETFGGAAGSANVPQGVGRHEGAEDPLEMNAFSGLGAFRGTWCQRKHAGERPGVAASADARCVARLLVVDELGWMELERGEGLSCALHLLEGGSTPRWPHALVVVRARLLEAARAQFEPAWGAVQVIHPDAEGAVAVARACGVDLALANECFT